MADEPITRWTAEFHTLRHDVHRLFMRREIFTELDAELFASQRAGTDLICEQFLRPMYMESQLVTIRRLADKDQRTVSFYHLLSEMAAEPESVLYPGRITREELLGYRSDLVRDAKRVGDYVNQHVAHRERTATSSLVWGDLNAAIDQIGEHMSGVSIALAGDSWDPEVYLTDAWKEVFAPGLFSPPLARGWSGSRGATGLSADGVLDKASVRGRKPTPPVTQP